MAKQDKLEQIREKIRQTLEKLGQAMDEWLNGRRPQPQPIPVPVDRPLRRRPSSPFNE